jgi:hypothetical protein
MVVPEGAARLSINQTISINWVYCYYYYYIFIAFDTSKVLEHAGVCVWCDRFGGITQIVILSRPNSS